MNYVDGLRTESGRITIFDQPAARRSSRSIFMRASPSFFPDSAQSAEWNSMHKFYEFEGMRQGSGCSAPTGPTLGQTVGAPASMTGLCSFGWRTGSFLSPGERDADRFSERSLLQMALWIVRIPGWRKEGPERLSVVVTN